MKRREDGRLQSSVTINGKRKWFYGDTKHELEMQKIEFREEKKKGEKFSTVADEWWEYYRTTISENSYFQSKAAYNYAVKTLGNEYINQLKPFNIARAIDELAKKGYTKKTIKRYLSTFSLIFKHAVRMGYCETNITRDVLVEKGKKSEKRKTPESKVIQIVKEHAFDDPYAMLCVWAMYTGMRRGELLALTWEDVDIENRRISVEKSLTPKRNIKLPKTESSFGSVPINDNLLKYIKKDGKKGFVFTKNGELYSDRNVRTIKDEFEKKYGVRPDLHAFRHATADMCIENNLNAVETQAILRHANADISIDTYASKRKQFTDIAFEKFKNADID